MLSVILFLLSLAASVSGLSVKWSNPVWISQFKLWESQCFLSMPATYQAKGNIQKNKLLVRVKRYALKSSPTNKKTTHLILLAGGPGQSIEIWEDDLRKIREYIHSLHLESHGKRDIILYLFEHRGVGQSTALFPGEDWKSTSPSDLKQMLSKKGLDGNAFSTANVALDVGRFAKHLKRHNKQSRLSLLGVSYGGMLAIQTISMFPNLFDWVILDSPSMLKGRFNPENDLNFWKNCLDHPQCKSKAISLEYLRYAYDVVMGGKVTNPCLKATVSDLSLRHLIPSLKKGHVEQAVKSPKLTSNMLLIPAILHAYQCRDSVYFEEQILSRIFQVVTGKQSDCLMGKERGPVMNSFMNGLICCSEIFQFSKPRPKECSRNHILTLTDQCSVRQSYLKCIYPIIEDLCYETGDLSDNNPMIAVKSTRAKVILLVGDLDLITPPKPAIDWLHRSKLPRKILINYRNHGHGLFPDAPCSELVLQLLTRRHSTKKNERQLRRCLDHVNRKPLDWDFNGEEYAFAKEWFQNL